MSKHQPDPAWVWKMSGLARDGTVKPFAHDQTLRREWGQGRIYVPLFLGRHKQDWQPNPAVCIILLNEMVIRRHVVRELYLNT